MNQNIANQFANQATHAAPRMATGGTVNSAASRGMGAVGQHIAGSAGGALTGAFAGNSLGLPGAMGDPNDPTFNLGGAALGALAGNRRLGAFAAQAGRRR